MAEAIAILPRLKSLIVEATTVFHAENHRRMIVEEKSPSATYSLFDKGRGCSPKRRSQARAQAEHERKGKVSPCLGRSAQGRSLHSIPLLHSPPFPIEPNTDRSAAATVSRPRGRPAPKGEEAAALPHLKLLIAEAIAILPRLESSIKHPREKPAHTSSRLLHSGRGLLLFSSRWFLPSGLGRFHVRIFHRWFLLGGMLLQ
ncbi:hypothetical protein BHM03_00009142 [Ensete ventricosum]|nr:hypothetical protein BHM03_00009142 [Ensete ventricosum]